MQDTLGATIMTTLEDAQRLYASMVAYDLVCEMQLSLLLDPSSPILLLQSDLLGPLWTFRPVTQKIDAVRAAPGLWAKCCSSVILNECRCRPQSLVQITCL